MILVEKDDSESRRSLTPIDDKFRLFFLFKARCVSEIIYFACKARFAHLDILTDPKLN